MIEPNKSYHYPIRNQNESAEDYLLRISKAGFVMISPYPEKWEDVKFKNPLNPEEIAEYIHEEFTPYSQMSLEAAKKHLAELIQRYADYELQKYKVSIELP